jgi:hypothetical protein
MKKFFKFILVGIFAVAIAAFAMFNMGLNSENDFDAVSLTSTKAFSKLSANSNCWARAKQPKTGVHYTKCTAGVDIYNPSKCQSIVLDHEYEEESIGFCSK